MATAAWTQATAWRMVVVRFEFQLLFSSLVRENKGEGVRFLFLSF